MTGETLSQERRHDLDKLIRKAIGRVLMPMVGAGKTVYVMDKIAPEILKDVEVFIRREEQ